MQKRSASSDLFMYMNRGAVPLGEKKNVCGTVFAISYNGGLLSGIYWGVKKGLASDILSCYGDM